MLIDGKVVPSNEAARYIAECPLLLPPDRIDPKKEPERFLRSLYLEYRSAYCAAGRCKSVTVKTT